jgi:hypothetical protein
LDLSTLVRLRHRADLVSGAAQLGAKLSALGATFGLEPSGDIVQ